MALNAALMLLAGLLFPQEPAPTRSQHLTPASWNTVGARLPALELPRIDGGGTINLGELRGRKLLLIHFASW
jgi:hypothetical protein